MNCPKCHHEMYAVTDARGTEQGFCLQDDCRYHTVKEIGASRPSIVIEIKDGVLANVYSDDDVQIALVDYDELDDGQSGSSSIVIPENLGKISPETKRLVIDAVRRATP